MPLLEWLERCTLPEEEPVADVAYAREVAAEFVNGLVEAGRRPRWCSAPTSAAAVDALFAEAEQAGLRTTSGLVVRDRLLPESAVDDTAARPRGGPRAGGRCPGPHEAAAP